MKTQARIIILSALILSLVKLNCLSQTWSYTTIYTPNHTGVTAKILTGDELTQDEKDDELNFWQTYYNYRLSYEGEATWTYNCHAWAWRVSEGGSTVWLNTPGDNAFWDDDSYIEISSQPDATKVNYGASCYYTHPDFGYADWCDHSAITTGTQDYFQSKWGAGPRFSHDKSDCPYDDQHLHYYARPYVTGSAFLCSGGSSYAINDLPSECSIVWTCSGNINRVSSQGSNPCTFQANGSGNGWISATITSNVDEIDLPQFAIYVGVPEIAYISGPTYTPNYQWATYYAQPNNPLMGSSDYSWVLNPLLDNVVYDYGWTADVAFYSSGNYQLLVRAQNTCGWGDYTMTSVEVYDSKLLSIFPNPASGEVSLTIESLNKNELPLSDWDLEIYDPGLILKEKKTKIKVNNIKINTSGWPEGIYMVRVKFKDEILSGKLIVKH